MPSLPYSTQGAQRTRLFFVKKLSRTVAANLKRLRKEAGLNQQALADRAGVHRNTVIAFEKGNQNSIKLDTLEAFAGALNVPVVALLAPIETTGIEDAKKEIRKFQKSMAEELSEDEIETLARAYWHWGTPKTSKAWFHAIELMRAQKQ